MKYDYYIGKTVKILALPGDPAEYRYIGKIGVVTSVSIDYDKEERLHGTWGGIALYPNHDIIEII